MKRILLVEDNIDLAGNIILILEEYNYQVDHAVSVKNGLEVMKKSRPDLILCDIMLPVTPGYKLLEEIKKMDSQMPPVFIFVTAKSQRKDLRKGMELGADDYVTKPFTSEELINAVKTQLDKREKIIGSKAVRDQEDADTKYSIHDRIFINDKKHPGLYPIEKIAYITTLKDYSQVVMDDQTKYIVRKSLRSWEEDLPADNFLRIHKTKLINVNLIQDIENSPNKTLKVTLRGFDQKFSVSQRISQRLKNDAIK